jgi:hypothetical protein
MLPHRCAPFDQEIRAPDVVDQNIQPALLALDPRDQGLHLSGDQMVGLHGDTEPTRLGHQFGRLFDRLGTIKFGWLGARGAARAVDGGAGGAQFGCDAAAGAAGGAGDQGDFAV